VAEYNANCILVYHDMIEGAHRKGTLNAKAIIRHDGVRDQEIHAPGEQHTVRADPDTKSPGRAMRDCQRQAGQVGGRAMMPTVRNRSHSG
jgi:hypothetical protein